jgi:hydrogenase maturation protease
MCRLADDARKTILILGLGNPLQGDDGVGCHVAQALEQLDLDDVEVMDGGTPGVGLLHLWDGRRRVILVDAADMGQPPGTVVRFRPEEVTLTGSTQRFSLHRSGVADALALARALDLKLPELVVLGVQPAQVGWGERLSPPVQAAFDQVVRAVLDEISPV